MSSPFGVRPITPAAFLALTLGAAAPAAAQDSVPLRCGIPANVHFLIHGFDTPTPNPGWQACEDAVAHLARSDVHRDIFELIALGRPPSRRAEFLDAVDEWFALLGEVDWPLLVEREVAFGYRLAMPMPEFVYLFRVPAEQAATQGHALGAVLREIGERLHFGDDAVTTRELDDGAGRLTTLDFPGAPLRFVAGHARDVVVLSTSARLGTWSARHIAAHDPAGSLLEKPSLDASLALLPEPGESIIYVDVDGILEFSSAMLRMAASATNAAAGDAPLAAFAAMGLDAAISVFDDIGDQVDHVVTVTSSDGRQATSTSLVRCDSGAAEGRLAALWADRRPWPEWRHLVPADATSFVFDSGLDPSAVADYIVELAELHGPVESDLEPGADARALLDAISGEVAMIELPAGNTLDACPFGESVLALRLDDPDHVAARLRPTLDAVVDFLASREQDATVTPLPDATGATLTAGAVPWLRPTAAVRDDLLLIATSPAALRRIDAAGESGDSHPAADLVDAAPHLAFGSYDVQRARFGLGDLCGTAGLALAVLPDELRQRPAIPIVARLLTRLAPALRRLELGYRSTWQQLPSPADDVVLSQVVYRFHDPSQDARSSLR